VISLSCWARRGLPPADHEQRRARQPAAAEIWLALSTRPRRIPAGSGACRHARATAFITSRASGKSRPATAPQASRSRTLRAARLDLNEPRGAFRRRFSPYHQPARRDRRHDLVEHVRSGPDAGRSSPAARVGDVPDQLVRPWPARRPPAGGALRADRYRSGRLADRRRSFRIHSTIAVDALRQEVAGTTTADQRLAETSSERGGCCCSVASASRKA